MGAAAQQLGALAALAESTSSVPNTGELTAALSVTAAQHTPLVHTGSGSKQKVMFLFLKKNGYEDSAGTRQDQDTLYKGTKLPKK